RGEVYFVNLDPTTGREQAGIRPAVVISNDTINSRPLVVTIVPGTKGRNVRRDFPSTVRVPPEASGLPEETVFMAMQVRALDHQRFPALPAGRLPNEYMRKVETVLRHCFEL